MLSIGSMNTWSGRYYMELASEDYYLDGGEPPGQWIGQGAEALGLSGEVNRAEFYYLMDGVAPDGSKRLVKDSAGKPHHPGWDLTFSAPKGVSLLWAMSNAETRRKIEAIHERAVAAAIAYLEDEAAVTRRGPQGRIREPVHVVVAAFPHGTSRAQDPELHMHALVLNVAVRRDGMAGALDGRRIYRHKMAAGAVYKTELASGLWQDLGLEVEPRANNTIELKGVPSAAILHFSKRRQELLERMQMRGETGARAAAVAALDTRTAKQHIPREQLTRQWLQEGLTVGFSREQAQALLRERSIAPAREAGLHEPSAAQPTGPAHRTHGPEHDTQQAMHEAIEAAWERLDTTQSSFVERDLVQALADEGATRRLSASRIRKAAREQMHDEERVRPAGKSSGENVYRTSRMEEALEDLLSRIERLSKDHSLDSNVVSNAVVHLGNFTMSAEQHRAFHHITRGGGRAVALDGWAGADVAHVLKAARQSLSASPYTLIGVTPFPATARTMEKETGIRTVTAARLLHDLDRTFLDDIKHHVTQIARQAGGLRTKPVEEAHITLTGKTILAVSGAHSISAWELGRIVGHVERSGAKIILTGDRRMPSRYQDLGLFGKVCQRIGAAALQRVEHKFSEVDRAAVKDIGRGDVVAALKPYAERGLLALAPSRADAADLLLDHWKLEALRRPHNYVIFTVSQKEADRINKRAQNYRKAAHELGDLALNVNGVSIHRRDRVRLLATQRSLGIDGGTLGTVLLVEPLTRNLVVKLDDGRIAAVPLLVYRNITLGYALPYGSAMETRVPNAYVLMHNPHQDTAGAYVQLSRSEMATRIYLSERDAGPQVSSFVPPPEEMVWPKDGPPGAFARARPFRPEDADRTSKAEGYRRTRDAGEARRDDQTRTRARPGAKEQTRTADPDRSMTETLGAEAPPVAVEIIRRPKGHAPGTRDNRPIPAQGNGHRRSRRPRQDMNHEHDVGIAR